MYRNFAVMVNMSNTREQLFAAPRIHNTEMLIVVITELAHKNDSQAFYVPSALSGAFIFLIKNDKNHQKWVILCRALQRKSW